jgi:DNA repair exonuclease SbcCD ATPase subunit
MKSLIKTINIIFISILLTGTALAQTSDYQVKKNFEEAHNELRVEIETAMTVKEVDSLMKEVSNLESLYKDREELLDHALYPETYSGSIDQLKQNARNTEHKLLIIEDKDEKLAKLSNELSSYRSEITHLNTRTDSLRNLISDSEQSEQKLSALVQRYRNSMEERDEFVLNMIDSLFTSYRDMDSKSIAEIGENAREIGNENNPLEILQVVMEKNIQILKANDGSLNTEDYLRMYVVQSRFSEVWNQIGNDLVTLYGGNNTSQWESNIEDKLGDWKASASKNMWASIDKHLEQQNVDLNAFDNNESFYSAIETFISNATDASRDKVVTNENYDDFQAFYDFWNGKIKNEWGEFVQEGEVLTMAQISSIDTEMMSWRDEAKPKSFLIPILFGLSLITIVGLIIVLARKN